MRNICASFKWGQRGRLKISSTKIIPKDQTSTLGPDFPLPFWSNTSGAEYFGDLETDNHINKKFSFHLRPTKVWKVWKQISTMMRKRRLTFYGHIKRINEERLKKLNCHIMKKHNLWIKELHRDLKHCTIRRENTHEKQRDV